VVRVFSETPINRIFQPVEATLEDVYFHRLSRREKPVATA
jgi:ABC-2 type transport system ATP-binding protein